MAATVFSFISEDDDESSNRTSTGTTPCATAMVTFLSSSLRRDKSESIAMARESDEPICNRAMRFLERDRTASRLEKAGVSRRRPLRKRTSQSVTWRWRVAMRESSWL